MIHVLMHCKVKDYSTWREGYGGLFAARQRAGERNCRIFHDSDHPDELFLLLEWESKKDAQAFFASEQWTSSLRKSGVKETPLPVFLDEARALHLTQAD